MDSPVAEKAEANFLNCSPVHSCQECCCNVKNELRDFREEITFLSHQVIQLMHVLCIRNCGCQRCVAFIGSSLETTLEGTFDASSPNNSGYANEDLNTTLFDKNSQIRALAVLNDASRRCRKRIAGGLDQLLPKLLAERESYAPVPTMASTQQESSNDGSVYLNDVPDLMTSEVAVNDAEGDPNNLANVEAKTIDLGNQIGQTNATNYKGEDDASYLLDGAACSSKNDSTRTKDETASLVAEMDCSGDVMDSSIGPVVLTVGPYPGRKLEGRQMSSISSSKPPTFFCMICNREFTNVYYKRHMIVHTNARPHVCSFCGKRFNERSNMLKHKQRLHGYKFELSVSGASAAV